MRQIKTAYTAPVINKTNLKNAYGVDLPPPIKHINFKLMQKEGRDAVLKEKQLPIERMTAVTIFSDRPYLHLMLSVSNPEIRRFTNDFVQKTSKYVDHSVNLPSHFVSVIQNMSASAARRAVKFMREQFTHLDTQIIQDVNLHPDLFINEVFVTSLIDTINNRA